MDDLMLDNPVPGLAAHVAPCITWDVDCDSGLNYYNRDNADTSSPRNRRRATTI
jgi:hypothetical protein